MKQDALDFRLSTPWQRGSHASFTGAVVAESGAGSQRLLLYGLIALRGPITQADLCRRSGYPINVVSARVRALVVQGLVRADGLERGPSGAQRTLWRAVTCDEREEMARQQATLEALR